MIYITGDTHGELARFSGKKMPLDAGDKVIVTGDFGFVLHNNLAEKNNLNALARKPYEILFVPGNHENYPALGRYPEVARYGNLARKLRENIFMLQTGNIYTIEGRTFFVFGGGYSSDQEWRLDYGRMCGGKIWFEEEMPSPEEYRQGLQSLQKSDMQVDFILTHTAPGSVIPEVINREPDPNERELNDFLDDVYRNVHFERWFFGHFHRDLQVNERMTACFTSLHKLEICGEESF